MKLQNLNLPILTLALLGSLVSAAQAAPQLAADPVAASFQRMLGHEASLSTPALPAASLRDPLDDAVSSLLRDEQRNAFHGSANYVLLSGQGKRGL